MVIEFVFQCVELGSNGSNLHWNALNPFRMVRIHIRMRRISFEGFEFICIGMLLIRFEWLELECFEFCSIGSNLHSNG